MTRPPSPPSYAINPLPLLDWVVERLDAGEEHLAASYLFDVMPGITAVADFRGAERFDDCLSILAATAPVEMRQRFGLQDTHEGEHGAGSIADEDLSTRVWRYE
jgi:hypothetical protein